jgi:hypothetical protein
MKILIEVIRRELGKLLAKVNAQAGQESWRNMVTGTTHHHTGASCPSSAQCPSWSCVQRGYWSAWWLLWCTVPCWSVSLFKSLPLHPEGVSSCICWQVAGLSSEVFPIHGWGIEARGCKGHRLAASKAACDMGRSTVLKIRKIIHLRNLFLWKTFCFTRLPSVVCIPSVRNRRR